MLQSTLLKPIPISSVMPLSHLMPAILDQPETKEGHYLYICSGIWLCLYIQSDTARCDQWVMRKLTVLMNSTTYTQLHLRDFGLLPISIYDLMRISQKHQLVWCLTWKSSLKEGVVLWGDFYSKFFDIILSHTILSYLCLVVDTFIILSRIHGCSMVDMRPTHGMMS